MSTFGIWKELSQNEVLDKIASFQIMEYGVYQKPLAKHLQELLTKNTGKSIRVVAALNNSDLEGVLLNIFKQNPKEVIEGMKLISYVLGAEELILQLPESVTIEDEWEDMLQKEGITLKRKFVDKRSYEGDYLGHIVTMAELFRHFNETYEEGVYVSIDQGELKRVSKDTKLSDLIDKSGKKGILCAEHYISIDEFDMTLEQANPINGVIKTLKDEDCIIQDVKNELLSYRKQSCGKCVFCREGLIQLESIHNDMIEGKAKAQSLSLAKEIGEAMLFSCACSLGGESSKVVLSAMEKFPDEYEEHSKKKKCRAEKCMAFINIYVDPLLCSGCEDCQDVCPKNCIEGKQGYIHMIDEFDCIKCGKCIKVCEDEAIIQTAGKIPKLPNRLVKVGKFKKH